MDRTETALATAPPAAPTRWEPPAYRIVPLDCEITAYAPDEEPLL